MVKNCKNSIRNFLITLSPLLFRGCQYVYRPYRLGWKIKGLIYSPTEFISQVSGITTDSTQINDYRYNLLKNDRLYYEVNKRYVKIRKRRTDFSEWHFILYVILRIIKPTVVLETGVFDGHSSVVILQALEDNGQGRLVSIDLPALKAITDSTNQMEFQTLPFGKQPGWLIPDYLRDRHELILDDTKNCLKATLEYVGKVTIFLHDSLHTFEHMMFEYETVYPYIEEGGYLLSDDVWANSAFTRFCRRISKRGYVTGDFGAIRK